MLGERNLVKVGVGLATLTIGRIHHSDGALLLLQLRRILLQEIEVVEIGLAITTENHIGGGDGEHIGLEFDAKELVAFDGTTLLFIGRLTKHIMHGGDEETAGATAGIKHAVGGFQLQQVAEKGGDMLGSEDNAETLTVAPAIGHKLAVEKTNPIFGRMNVLDVLEDALVQELDIIAERRLLQYRVNLVDFGRVANDRELRE